MKSTYLFMISALSLAACATAKVPDYTASLGGAPALGGGTYTSGGGLSLAADIRERDGRTLVCGVWAQSQQQSILTKGKARHVVERGAVMLDGEVVTRGLAFMQEVAPAPDYAGSSANCRLTERAWRPGDEARSLSVRIPRHVVHREYDDVGGGFNVTFRPGGPGAGAR